MTEAYGGLKERMEEARMHMREAKNEQQHAMWKRVFRKLRNQINAAISLAERGKK